jgi:N-acetylneuraminic acid mutarotase
VLYSCHPPAPFCWLQCFTLLAKLETDLRTAFDESLVGLVATARTQLKGALREINTMHMHKEVQEGHVVLNIGGYRYETSVQTLCQLPYTFFDAYFSGRYAQFVCADASIFVDRDGEHFGQVLEYLRDGVVSVAEQDASELNVGVLRWLKREFGFYCIELTAKQQEVAFVAGGDTSDGVYTASVERYDVASGSWWEAAPMITARANFALCGLGGELYAIGGMDTENSMLASVERYDPCLNSWSAAMPLPQARAGHCAAAVGDAIYVMGGMELLDGLSLPLSNALKYDSSAQFWSEVAPIPEPRVEAAACVLRSEIYIFGGRGLNDAVAATTFCYNMQMDAWRTLAPMPAAVDCHTVCVVEGLIYVLGGRFSDDTAVSSVHRYDPVANLWITVVPMSTPRSSCASFVINGNIQIVGGWDGRRRLASAERYDAVSNSWSTTTSMGQYKDGLSAQAMWVELNLFDSLILKAESARH